MLSDKDCLRYVLCRLYKEASSKYREGEQELVDLTEIWESALQIVNDVPEPATDTPRLTELPEGT